MNLRICFELRKKIAAVEMKLAALTESVGSMTAAYGERVTASPHFDSAVERLILLRLETEQRLRDLQQELAIAEAETLALLQSVELSAVEFELMRLRYVDCQPFAEIEKAMCYSTSSIFRLHRQARVKVLAALADEVPTEASNAAAV